ncbi:MAG: SDR family oxidoreductase [Alphaproteobacteria bacterium]
MVRFDRPVLVTGAAGCIGAWVVARLLREGSPAVVFDLSGERHRLNLLVGEAEAARVPWHQGDIADPEALEAVVAEHGVGAILHLAALQVPFCKADPVAGALANVVGQVNVLEIARRHGIRRLVYASSIAVWSAAGEPHPATLYGVYKTADEGIARIYWQDWSVPSVGLRPHTVYGEGRDQGLTSAPTKAMLAAAAGRPFTIPFAGRLQFQHAGDVAEAILRCAAAKLAGAEVYDLGGPPVAVEEIVTAIRHVVDGADIVCEGDPLPFPDARQAGALDSVVGPLEWTPLEEGVARTVAAFRDLLARGLVSPAD